MEAEDPTATVVNPCLSGMLEAVHEAEEFLFNKMEEKTKEIKVLENNDIESLVTEKKEILKEIIDLKTKISLYDENCENEQKGIDSSAEENDQMVMRKTIELKRVEDDLALLQGQYMIRKQELEEAKQNLRECRVGDQLKLGVSQNWTLEQSQSELAEREYFKHHAKTPSGRNTFTEMQDNPSSGEIQPKITPSTPQTFTRNPAPPTPMEITASGIPLHLLGGFTRILTDSSSDGNGCGITRREETQEDKTHGHSSDKRFISDSE
ncbi:uncharacterized protein [Macrobrachium rosenbergii]|uniref:uncharacterized protein isoform X3 n=1 Tax=Macrobrachium rosenbergii TaxID=79674 RepID=UPI0034D6A552